MRRPPILPVIIGSGFGSGFWPFGPGTAGALLATILWWAGGCVLSSPQITAVTLVACIVFTGLGAWAANRLAPYWGDDPHRVVIDEMVGVWIPLLIVPVGDFWLTLAAFLLFRFFDILKPLGIRSLDRRKGGFWVMADDIVAGIYSLVVIAVIEWVR